jgi:hypothetical protein
MGEEVQVHCLRPVSAVEVVACKNIQQAVAADRPDTGAG